MLIRISVIVWAAGSLCIILNSLIYEGDGILVFMGYGLLAGISINLILRYWAKKHPPKEDQETAAPTRSLIMFFYILPVIIGGSLLQCAHTMRPLEILGNCFWILGLILQGIHLHRMRTDAIKNGKAYPYDCEPL